MSRNASPFFEICFSKICLILEWKTDAILTVTKLNRQNDNKTTLELKDGKLWNEYLQISKNKVKLIEFFWKTRE